MIAGGVVWSGERLGAEAEIVAGALCRLGLGPADRAALVLGNTAAFAAAYLGLMKLGVSAVLVNPQCAVREMDESLRRTSAVAVLGAPPLAGRLRQIGDVSGEPPAPVDREGSLLLWRTAHARAAAGCDELMVQFTSGASGRPKVVARTFANLAFELDTFASHVPVGREDATVCPCPLSHSYGLLNGLLMPLFGGRPAVLLDGLFLPNDVVAAVHAHRARVLAGVPAMYRALADAYGAEASELASLRLCYSAGAPLPAPVCEAFARRYGRHLHQQYGSTETGVIAVNLMDGAHPNPLAAGRPVRGRQVTVHREDGTVADPGESGEVVVRSDACAREYVDDPQLTAEQFKGGAYLTGDIGSVDALGEITLLGRRSRVINVGGYKVDPAEVEAVLSALEAVAECAVVPRRRRDGESLEAVVVVRHDVSAQEIQQFCRERLAAYKVPRHISIVERLPRSLSGKVLLKELME